MNIFYKFTWRSLKENKTRTIVTILGIMLSVSLITATLTSVSSLFEFMRNVMGDEYGTWHLCVDNLTDDKLGEMKKEDGVDESAVMYNIGYAKLEKSYVSDRPYLYVGAYDGDLDAICNFSVKEGRMPQNSSELILPLDLEESGGIKYNVGDTLNLDLGVRTDNGHMVSEIWRFNSYSGGEDASEQEKWKKVNTKAYTVVGKYSCGMFEGIRLAGFTGITKADEAMQARSAAFFATLDNTGGILKESFSEDFYKAHPGYEGNVVMDVNRNYLQVTDNMGGELKAMLIGLITMLLLIIAFGSIALIYNSFSISINERKKQYGLLSSIGATKRQLKKSMIFEAVVLSAIGIPLGLLLGIGGISTTFYLLRDVFSRFLITGSGISLEFSASLAAIAIAVVVSFFTILFSAWIPARKAVKVSAIEAIRQNDEILVKPRKLRTSGLTEKLFKLEGTLALKNFRRNKRRYRATIFSLFMSIVLFISATSFCDYMESALGEVRDHYDSDIEYRCEREDMDQVYEALGTVKGVKRSVRYLDSSMGMLVVKSDNLTEDAKRYLASETEGADGESELSCFCFFVNDGDYAKYLEENGYSKEKYMDAKNPKALVYNSSTQYDSAEKKYVIFSILKKTDMSAAIHVEGARQEIELGSFCEEVPFGTKGYTGGTPLLYYPMSALPKYEKLFSGKEDGESYLTANIAFGAEDPDACALSMKKVLEAREMDINGLYNVYASQQSSIALMTVIRVFSNGFIILILLIALANVFNTIATGIMLRRREFAMLRSIGMTHKGFRRMMNFECLMYGGKGILYGLPVAILATYGIYRAIRESIIVSFYVPWYGVAIAIGSVFLVVFATMIYSVHKVNKENVVDVLKEDTF